MVLGEHHSDHSSVEGNERATCLPTRGGRETMIGPKAFSSVRRNHANRLVSQWAHKSSAGQWLTKRFKKFCGKALKLLKLRKIDLPSVAELLQVQPKTEMGISDTNLYKVFQGTGGWNVLSRTMWIGCHLQNQTRDVCWTLRDTWHSMVLRIKKDRGIDKTPKTAGLPAEANTVDHSDRATHCANTNNSSNNY